ncbi:MAG: NAD-dependent epimerase/dehydratase family protein [Acidobacteriota bacterium]
MRILVTGAGGFLGRAIACRLVERGDSVRSFSRGSHPELKQLGIEQQQGDLADAQAVLEACRGVDLVFHVGAKAGIWGRRRDFYRTNVLGTRNVLEACRTLRIERLVYTSSPSVVFDGKDMEGVDESVPYPARFRAAYPETKAAAERLVLSANSSALATVSLRPHLIWGPGDTNLIPGILARGRKGGLRQIGTAKKLVDFTYIDNAAEAHLCAADHLSPGRPAAGKAYFISQAEPMPTWEFVNRILASAGLPPVEKSVPRSVAYAGGALLEVLYRLLPVSGEPRLTRFLAEELSTAHWFDISAARRDLAYQPVVSMEEGFRRLQASLSPR